MVYNPIKKVVDELLKVTPDFDSDCDDDMLLIQHKLQVDKAIRARLRRQIQSIVANVSELDDMVSNGSSTDTELHFDVHFDFVD